MSTKPVEAPPQGSAAPSRQPATAGIGERRRRGRLQVHWRICFWGGALTETVETVTRNLSSDGFYCLSKVPFVPGEKLACTLKIPGHQAGEAGLDSELSCRVQVVRIDPADREGYFGMACRIEEYRVAHHFLHNH